MTLDQLAYYLLKTLGHLIDLQISSTMLQHTYITGQLDENALHNVVGYIVHSLQDCCTVVVFLDIEGECDIGSHLGILRRF